MFALQSKTKISPLEENRQHATLPYIKPEMKMEMGYTASGPFPIHEAEAK
jgi:hypothetical protein